MAACPGSTRLNQLDPQHSFWVKGPQFRFSWNTPPAIVNPLRAGLLEGSDDRKRVRAALAGYDAAIADKAIAQAAHELATLSDEALFTAWLRSDREVLAERDELVPAVREALLLVARRDGGPVVTFHQPGGEHVYLVPLNSRTATVWLEVDFFDAAGSLMDSGILQVDETKPSVPADPADVRRIAAQVSLLAFPPAAATTSTRPAGAQVLHQQP